MKGPLSLLFAVALFVTSALAADLVSGPAQIIDGDTLRVSGTSVHLFGVDAPETPDPLGVVARRALEEIVDDQPVICTPTGATRFQRPVARCSVNGQAVGEILIRSGNSFAACSFASEYYPAEAAARTNGLGFWRDPNAKDEWDKLAAWGPFAGAFLGAIALVVAAFVAYGLNRRQRTWEFEQERRAVASAFLGEVDAVFSIIRVRRYEEAFAEVEAEHQRTGQVSLPYLPIRERYFIVYEENSGKLGLLPHPLPQKIVQLYIMLKAVKEDFQSIVEGLWNRVLVSDAEKLELARDVHALLVQARELGSEVSLELGDLIDPAFNKHRRQHNIYSAFSKRWRQQS